ncbi:MAG: N-acetylmuramoyl-L-alanine amidase [Cardiobacteriaceae bacterium]|nr:N-acetylmuramoyl-L-alanine amidase [Cardiobacteriaceae bacterium]
MRRIGISIFCKWRIIAIILLGLCSVAPALSVTLQDIRYNRMQDKVQLVLDLDRPTIFQQFSLAGPPRIVLDLPDANRTGRAGMAINTGAVGNIRTGFTRDTTLRIVIDLLYVAKANIYTAPPENGHGNRIVIDIYDHVSDPALTLESLDAEQPPFVVFAGQALEDERHLESTNPLSPTVIDRQPVLPPRTQQSPVQKTPIAVSPQPNRPPVVITSPPPPSITTPSVTSSPPATIQKKPTPNVTVERKISATGKVEKQSKIITPTMISKKNIIVAIDPGHGGKDSGAMNRVTGLREKDVVLQIAHRLKKLLDSKKGFRAILTRSDDTYIPLKERPAIARRQGADIFVSIHADAVESDEPSGSSVYMLSTKGASSQLAKYLERSENAVDLRWGVDVSKYDDDIQEALLNIQQEATLESSYVLATQTLNELRRLGKIHKPNVERANFVVLRSPEIPSMLVETAFISNPEEARKLSSPTYQEQLAMGIANGITHYFEEHLPQHMLLGK